MMLTCKAPSLLFKDFLKFCKVILICIKTTSESVILARRLKTHEIEDKSCYFLIHQEHESGC